MSTKTFTATSSNGTTFTRTSKTMDYKFVVVGRQCGHGDFKRDYLTGGRKYIGLRLSDKVSEVFEVIGWSQTQKGADVFARQGATGSTNIHIAYTDIEILPVA